MHLPIDASLLYDSSPLSRKRQPSPWKLWDTVVCDMGWQTTKSGLLFIFEKKTVLEHRRIHLCTVRTTMAELNGCNRNHMAHKARSIYYLALYKKVYPSNIWYKFWVKNDSYLTHLKNTINSKMQQQKCE